MSMGRANEIEAQLAKQTWETGDDYLSKEEAANILGKSTRTIFRYLDRGWLKPISRGGQVGATRASVYELKQEIDKEVNPYLVTIGMLESRLMVVEGRVSAMMRLLNLKNQTLTLTDPEALSLYNMVDHSAKNGWTPHNEEILIDTFMRLDESNMEQFEKLVGDDHPWRPFLMLAGTMRHAAFNRQLQTDIELAASHLNVLAQMWCRRKGETAKAFELLSVRDSAPLKKLINRMERDRLKTNVPGEA